MTNQDEPAGARIWHFGSATLDERDMVLRVANQAVNLERQSKAVLQFLLEHANEVVTKDEMFEEVWAGRVVSEATLAKSISRIRSALGEAGRDMVQTAHGYGYRLVAAVSMETAPRGTEARLEFRIGDKPPGRPDWELQHSLGSGGHGEAWLARQGRSGEEHVFKFALNRDSLSSLKREITLNRILADAPRARDYCVQLKGWNLESAPYFIECEYVASGNLADWIDARGGWDAVPLPERLALMADIAEALSWVHEAGVIHKDIKPANVLVQDTPEGPCVKLADFGSGAVSREKLSEAGITRRGFTHSTELERYSGGTLMYMAPETIAGQPPTIRGDIFGLGVMLYQLAVGDFSRPLAAGWEADISDSLLRQDIADAANGQLQRRIADAGQLAARLRGLPQRHRQAVAREQAEERVRRAEALRAQVKRWRVAAASMLLLSGVAVVAGVAAHSARNAALEAQGQALQARDEAVAERGRADAAAATTQAVSDFMNDELLGGVQWSDATTKISLKDMLDKVSSRVDSRLNDYPDAAAEVHFVLGMRYGMSGYTEAAKSQWSRGLSILVDAHGEDAIETVRGRHLNGLILAISGDFQGARAYFAGAVAILENLRGPGHLMTLYERSQVAEADMYAGRPLLALAELQQIAELAPDAAELDAADAKLFAKFGEGSEGADVRVPLGQKLATVAHEKMGILYNRLRHQDAAEKHLRAAIESYETLYGEDTRTTLEAAVNLIEVLARQQRFAEAEALADRVRDDMTGPASKDNITGLIVLHRRGLLRLEERRYSEAVAILRKAWALCPGAPEQGCFYSESREIPEALARGLIGIGETSEALALFERIRTARLSSDGPDSLSLIPATLGLAEAQLYNDQARLALQTLEPLEDRLRQQLPGEAALLSELARVRVAILRQLRNDQAGEALQQALRLTADVYGPDHWRTLELRKMLDEA